MDPSVAAHCLTEDHVSPLLEGETLRNAARRLLQEDEGHGSLGLLAHLHHALLQLGHQRAQMLPPVACGVWDGEEGGVRKRRAGGSSDNNNRDLVTRHRVLCGFVLPHKVI